MNTIWIVMPILIVLMFLLGIDMSKKAFTDIAHNPKAVLLGLIGQLVILPVIAFLIAWILKLPPVYFMGLVLVACCPGGSSSNIFSMLAKGEVELSVTLTALSSIMTLFTLPLIMEFVAEAVSDMSGVRIELPVGKLLVQNIVLIFLPLFAGICDDEKAKKLVEHLTNPKEFRTEFPIPSISIDDSTYGIDMWKGPV